MRKLVYIVSLLLFCSLFLPACKSNKRKSQATFTKNNLKTKQKSNKKAKNNNGNNSSQTFSKKANKNAQEVIDVAKTYIGTPYKYGGNTRAGLDCSGLVFLSFSKKGYELPRSSHQMAETGRTVQLSDIEPGDLVFFIIGGGKKINHVGLVTEVTEKGIKFIHATTKLGVTENYLEVDYYKNSFEKAIRPNYK